MFWKLLANILVGLEAGVPRMNMQVTDMRMIIIHPLHGNNSNKLRNNYHQLKKNITEEKKIYRSFNNHKLLIYTAVGIIGAIVLAGFIISGGLLPNVNKGATLQPLPSPLPPRSLSSA